MGYEENIWLDANWKWKKSYNIVAGFEAPRYSTLYQNYSYNTEKWMKHSC